jgi:hypothetical protein
MSAVPLLEVHGAHLALQRDGTLLKPGDALM